MPMDAAYEAMRDENDLLRSELYKLRKKLNECELQRDYLQRELDVFRNNYTQNWISVAELQPTENGKYLVAYRLKNGGWKVRAARYSGGEWCNVGYNVTHWMPHPAPPEME